MMTLTRLLRLPLIAAALLVPAPLALAQQGLPGLEAFSRRLMADLDQTGADLAAEGLAQWILASRADALRAGVTPVPEAIRAKLKGHFPDAVLARVRYRVDSGHQFSLQNNAFRNNADAITLDEVVLFRPGRNGTGDAQLWAHELTHVVQYQRWGVRGFARRYTQNYRAVEAEAETNARRIGAALAASRGLPRQP